MENDGVGVGVVNAELSAVPFLRPPFTITDASCHELYMYVYFATGKNNFYYFIINQIMILEVKLSILHADWAKRVLD